MSLHELIANDTPPLAIPTIYFNTEIISYVAKGRIPHYQWRNVCAYLSTHAHHCISLSTLYELLAGMAYGREEDFLFYRDRLRALRGAPGTTYAPLAGEFVRTRVFNLVLKRQDFSPDRLRDWIPVVLRAQRREELTSGQVVVDERDILSFGINLRLIQCQILRGKAAHIRRLKSLRKSHPDKFSIHDWAARMVKQLGLELTLENRQMVERGLNAAYYHDVWIRNQARNDNYYFKKHASAWLDSQQLYYLADPTYIFVTNDRQLRDAVAASSQANRIISFDDLASLASPC